VSRIHGIGYERIGAGDPLLLIHGTGGARSAWQPVVPLLSSHHEVVLVDLPGHGDSDLPPPGVEPTPIGYAPVLADLLDAIGVGTAHAAGFSVGGWTSLELAKMGRARSVTAFGPAGLWRPRSPRPSELSLWLSRKMARALSPVLPLALRSAAGRTLILSQQLGRPWRMPADAARQTVRNIAGTRGFAEHLAATNRTRFTGGQEIEVPVTIAFGSRERLLSKRRARRREELPADARWVTLSGCGHIPMWDDPELTAGTILQTTQPA
jgi:pimeloyl-ACP methyl ester carboxylesterase